MIFDREIEMKPSIYKKQFDQTKNFQIPMKPSRNFFRKFCCMR